MKKKKYTITDDVLKARAKMTKIDRNIKVLELLKEGHSLRDLEKVFGITYEAIRKIGKNSKEYYEKLKQLSVDNN